jgi:hypothetical protein
MLCRMLLLSLLLVALSSVGAEIYDDQRRLAAVDKGKSVKIVAYSPIKVIIFLL